MNELERAKKILELRRRKLKLEAAGHFSPFLVYSSAKYDAQWFHKLIADKCEALLRGEIKNLMVFIPPQHGKALPIETPILTTKGWKRHGDLSAGDYVFGEDGRPRRVIANTGAYLWRTMEIGFADGQRIIAAPEHEWKIYADHDDHKGRVAEIRETQEIFSRRHRRAPFIPAGVCLEMPDKELPIDPYILGVWLGDGISSNGYIVSGSEDAPHFSQLGEAKKERENFYRIKIDGLYRSLRLSGLLKNKHIPEIYFTASKSQRRALLQGLMDTDGTIDKGGNNAEFTQKESRLAEDVYTLMRSLGYKPTKHYYDMKLDGRIVGRKVRLMFRPDKGDELFRLKRKQERLDNKTKADRDDKRKLFIKGIEEAEERLVNCIQVEGGLYLAGRDLILTHNSEIVSRNFPAWALGQDPDLKIVGCSYSADLADQFSLSIQRTIDSSEYQAIFPDTFLNGSGSRKSQKGYKRNLDHFECVGHSGFYKAVGVGGGLTGTPVDIAIIDDPIKDAMEAQSPIYRERVWQWYNTVLTTRLHNASHQLFIMTRWHEDDLAGRLLKKEPQEWEVISIPAICEAAGDGGYSGRKIGDALWPSRHSLEKLLKQQQRAPREFNALYQQHPSVEGGNIVKRDWFRHISPAEFRSLRFNEPIHFFLDTAYGKKKVGQDNDPSGILAACAIKNNLYILDAQKVYKEMPDLLRFLPEYIHAHGGNRESILSVEPKANGESVVQMLKTISSLNVKRTETPTDSKEVRLRVASPPIECGRVYLVDGSWCDSFMDEICAFPNAPHDEFADILGYAISALLEDDDDIDYDQLDKSMFGL